MLECATIERSKTGKEPILLVEKLMNMRKCALLLAVAGSGLGIFADASFAGIAKAAGGSGFSGNLSSNKTLRKQQLIADPSYAATTGSTSISYNPNLVTLTDVAAGPGYVITSANVAEQVSGSSDSSSSQAYTVIQSVSDFLSSPEGTQTGYVQVSYMLTGTPGTMSPSSGFSQVASNGVAGVDTHAITFAYLPGVADNAVARYSIFAGTANSNPTGMADSLVTSTGVTIPASQISSAAVSGSLTAAVPLPPAVWTGSAMLLGLISLSAVRKARATRAS